MARGKSGATYTVSTDVTSGDPEGLSTSGRSPTITNSPRRTSSTIKNFAGRTPTTRKNSLGQSPTTKMLQPEMSDMPMSAMSREISTRRQRRRPENDTQNDDQAEDIAKIKEGHSIRGTVMKVVRLIIPHVALMTVFFIYLAFGAWVFYTLENNCSEECQSTIYEAKIAMVDIARNGTDCNRNESSPRPAQDALGRTSSGKGGDRGRHSKGSDDCEDEMMDKIDEHFDLVMKMMVRSGMTVGKMDSYLVGRTWNLTSAMLFSMTTITTIGYGDITPETTGGRVFCIIYSIFGIPLALLCLANIGNLLARLTLKICRTTHHWLARHKVCTRCRKCRRPTNHPDTSSQRRIMNGDVEIPMETVDKPPPYESQVKETKNEAKTKQTLDENTNDHTFTRSVSIATERPTSHPHGVTKQPGVDPCELQGLPPCGCEPNKCRCEHKPDVLEEVPLLVVVVILVVYMCGGAAWMASAEGWDFGTGIYFMFITLTTIGFGDVLPMKHYGDNTFIPCLFFTLFGLAIMSMCIALVQVKVLRGYQWVTSKTGLC